MNFNKFSISPPIARENEHVPKHYVQYLHYENESLVFQSNAFTSNGPKLGLNKGFQLLTTLSKETRDMLSQVEQYAITNLQLPAPIAEKWQQHMENSGDTVPFKRLYEGTNLYIKLAHDVQLFNMDHFENGKYQPFPSNPPLGRGSYVVLIEAPMIYIGSHNANPKVASLHLRITQIVYRPKALGECRIVPFLNTINSCELNNEQSVSDDKVIQTDAKSSRKRTSNKKLKKSGDHLQDVIDSIIVSS